MNAKKWLALLLSLTLLLGLLPGAALAADDETTELIAENDSAELIAENDDADAEEAEDSAETEEAEEEEDEIDAAFRTASTAYPADTLVATVNGEEITWRMFFYFIYGTIYQYSYYYGMPDFTADGGEGTTYGEALTASVEARMKYYTVPRVKAAEAGLDSQVDAAAQEQWELLLENYESEEAVTELLENEYLDKDTFLYLLGSNAAFNELMNASYGADGSKMTDDEVLSWAEEQGYMRAKHILYLFTDDDGNALDDDAKAELLETANSALAELRALEGDREKMLARFEEIMNEVGGDPGMTTFPDGYTFTDGAMVEEFENGTKALGEYGISDVVETSYGYHIILRLPLDPDTATLSQDSGTGEYLTLRADAANEAFNNMLTGWINESTVEWEADFENLDYNALFGVEPAAAEDTAAEATEEPAAAAEVEETEESGKTNVWMYAAIAAAVIIVALVAVIIGQKKNASAKAEESATTADAAPAEDVAPTAESEKPEAETETAPEAAEAGTEVKAEEAAPEEAEPEEPETAAPEAENKEEE